MKRFWSLDPSIDFLNHGSFGACPLAVLEAQVEWRARMERQPVQFFARDLEKLLDEVRSALGEFLGASPDDLALVSNATAGVNTVLRSLELSPGDELLTTSHAYNACVNALRMHASRGVVVRVAEVPWPLRSPAQVIDAVLAAIGPRTKLLLLDHVTSPTGLVFPVEEIVRRAPVDCLVDGAHAPGMLPLRLDALGAAYYTGNCHKWMCAPKGAAFLHVRRDRQAGLRPLSISHGANAQRIDRSRFRLEFDWAGTDDPTPWLSIPAALRFFAGVVPGGFPEVMARNRALALRGRDLLCAALGVEKPAPDEMLGSLAAVPLPDLREPFAQGAGLFWHPLQARIYSKYNIEAPVFLFPRAPRQLVRISAQLYNTADQFERLGTALRRELAA